MRMRALSKVRFQRRLHPHWKRGHNTLAVHFCDKHKPQRVPLLANGKKVWGIEELSPLGCALTETLDAPVAVSIV